MYTLIFLFHGLLAILTQLVIFRELSVLFYGSELFLGTFLSSWLFWVGLGSLLAKPLWNKLRAKRVNLFSYSFLVVSLCLPFVILLIRSSKSLFSFGEFIGPVGTVLFTFAAMSFLCFIIGAQFSLGCAIISGRIKIGSALSRVYLCEALGAVIGGVLFTYVLIGFVPTFTIGLIMSLGCILVYGILKLPVRPRRSTYAVGQVISLIIAALAILFVSFKIEPTINKLQWIRYNLIKQKEGRHATLTLAKIGSITNVFVNGMLSASFPDPENYESVTHWPLLAIDEPGRILIMGGLSLGVLKEVLKHSPGSVDYVLLDNSFIDLVGPYLGDEDISALEDPRINIYYGDSRIFVKNKENRYDAVIMNIQEVPNLKLNRFYTQEFYTRIRSALKPKGILALSITSSENYLSAQTRMFNASVYNTLKSVFQATELIPGDSIMFLCSPSAIDIRRETISRRFRNRRISNRYFTPAVIEYKLTPERRIELKKTLEETQGVEINRDFSPTTYYYFTNFWLNKFTSPLGYLIVCVLLAIIGLVIFNIIGNYILPPCFVSLHSTKQNRGDCEKSPKSLCQKGQIFLDKRKSLVFLNQRRECIIIFIIGFMGILLELILLLGFQIISGYVYWQMGILFAAFMLGLFLGSLLASQFQYGSRQKHFIFLVILSAAIIGLSIYTGYLLPRLINLSTVQNIVIFPGLLILIGVIVGASFVIASFLISGDEIMVKSGSLYAADLWGAASGAILTTNFIIPVFGLLGALNFSAIVGSIGLILFLVLSKNAR